MRRAKKSLMLLFMVLAVFLLVQACGSTGQMQESPSDTVCSSIINAKCVRCHYKTRICDALGTKSLGGWKRSIKFMVKQGAELTDEEQNNVIACLHSLPKGSNLVCE